MSGRIFLPSEPPPNLPSHANGVDEKLYLTPKNSAQNSRLLLTVPQRAWSWATSTKRRMVASLLFLLTWLALGWMGYSLILGTIPLSLSGESTLILGRADLEKIWRWEIASGHYPSRRPVPDFIDIKGPIQNPGLPVDITARHSQPGSTSEMPSTVGTGPARKYVSAQISPLNSRYPPRPPSGGIADLDVVMDHCDFSTHKYVSDCLEFMRIGAGLSLDERSGITHRTLNNFIYLQDKDHKTPSDKIDHDAVPAQQQIIGLTGVDDRPHPESLPPLPPSQKLKPSNNACDPDHPRIFHTYWAGEFTDKPYMALLSYLFTQNLGLDRKVDAPLPTDLCRPQFWVWINPGRAVTNRDPSAPEDLFDSLRASPWASPFLHPRFAEVIKFKLWNTTEQLDSIPELKDEWRTHGIEQHYDRMPAILSDIARFVLCHRFGGTYLDTNTILLRDWEELWGYKGAFTYEWSPLETYNNAVLHLNKGSALGTFLFRTALHNGLDFHPMTIWKYVQQANLEGLLLRLPDALFDSAWLNTEGYQRNRPASPYFTELRQFFEPSKTEVEAPKLVGFDGFFRGAYSYHFHEHWWLSFDPARNYPDLGPRFAQGKPQTREGIIGKLPKDTGVAEEWEDLSWAAVLKRTFEAFVRGEKPNMYGEWIEW